MMQSEFENLLGHGVSIEAYRVIEFCYVNFDYLFPSKQSVVSYYKKHDLNFFENLKKDYYVFEKEKEKLKKENENLEKKIKEYENKLLSIQQILSTTESGY